MKPFSPAELSHEIMLEKKTKSNKTCCNQNMPAFPLSDDLKCWSTITFSYNCFRQRIRVFLSVNEPILHRLVSNCYDYLLTFTMMHSRWNKLIVSCRKLNVSSSKMEKRLALLYEFWQTRDNLNSYTRLDYTILPLLRHLTYLWLCPSFGLPLCGSSACYIGFLFVKHSSPALIRTEPRGHDEKKKI